MLFDDLKEYIKNSHQDLDIIKTYWSHARIEEQYHHLKTRSLEENFWKDPQQLAISKELQKISTQREQYLALIAEYQELSAFIDLFAEDEDSLKKIEPEVIALCKHIRQFKLASLLTEENDMANCFLSINAGAGGTESQDWANMLLRMYLRFCERERLQASIIDYQPGEAAGIKSSTLFIKGKNAYGILKGEHGIHRLVRISPFDANKRRHTSFAAAFIVPEAPHINITIDPKDLRIDTYRAGGAGGQHVNKTDSAVRITHIPSGIVVQCQSERSQTQNKETAMKLLMAKLLQKEKEESLAKTESLERKKIEWGSQIRSYVLHPYKLVKDHRTDLESPQPELVLDGELLPFIESYLVWLTKINAEQKG